MGSLRHTYLVYAVFGIVLCLPAMQAVAQPDFVARQWTIEDGLPQSSVYAIEQSRGGYLWLATAGGLARFDGLRFKIFGVNTTDAFRSNRLTDLYEDKNGALWIGSTEGIVRWQEGVFSAVTRPRALAHGYIPPNGIAADSSGTLWVLAQRGDRMRLYRRVEGRFKPFLPQTDTEFFRSIVVSYQGLYIDQADRIWLIGYHSIALYEHGAVRIFVPTPNPEPGNDLVAFTEDARGTIYAGTRQGELYVFKDSRFQPLPLPGRGPRHVNAFWCGRTNRCILISESHDVWTFNPRTQQGSLVARLDVDISGTTINRDTEGNIWIGAYREGLLRVSPALFNVYDHRDGLSQASFVSIAGTPDGRVWAAPSCSGLNVIQDGRARPYVTGVSSEGCIRTITVDEKGTLWIASSNVARLKQAGWQSISVGDPIWALYPDPQRAGAVWIGATGGVYRVANGQVETMALEGKSAFTPIHAFLRDSRGVMWAAGEGALYRRKPGETAFSRVNADFPDTVLRALFEDPVDPGVLWIGTYGAGLLRWKGGQITRITTRDGLFDNVVSNILPDAQGNVWMGGNRGIFRAKLAGLRAFSEGRTNRIVSVGYGTEAGLTTAETNGAFNSSAWKAPDGRLWFAMIDGVAVVDPSDVVANAVPPAVHVETVIHENVPQPMRGGVNLGSRQRNFEVRYTGISLSAPEKVRFRYRLRGLSDTWTNVGTERNVYFANVPPGHYVFEVQAANRDGVWSVAGAEVPIYIAPFVFETSWFWMLCAALIFGGAVAGYRARVRYLRRRERTLERMVDRQTLELSREKEASERAWKEAERQRSAAEDALDSVEEQAVKLLALDRAKSRFFANISHEFRTPLTLILGPMERAQNGEHGDLSPALSADLDMTLRNGERLLHLINQILDLAKLEAGSLTRNDAPHDLAESLRRMIAAFAPLAKEAGVALDFSGPESLIISCDAEQIGRVWANLLSNAIKFTSAGGRIGVKVTRSGEFAGVTVKDTGRGIPSDQIARIFDRFYQVENQDLASPGTGIGLALAKEVVELHDGEITVESVYGEGTTVSVQLPIRREDGARPTKVTTDAEGIALQGRDSDSAYMVERYVDAPLSGDGSKEAPFLDSDLHLPPAGDGLAEEAGEEAKDPSHDQTTILIVDDDVDMRRHVALIFSLEYRVLQAADGRSGLEAARDALPDLIIADVMMPGMDGLALSRALKEEPILESTPLILLTARASTESELEGLGTGSDDYVTKPFEAALLKARVENLIAQRRRLRDILRREGLGDLPVRDDGQPPLARRAREVVRERLTDESFGVNEMASELAMSYSKLYRDLREALDVTPTEFIRQVRLEEGARLLRATDEGVADVAYAVGFNSRRYFTRCFTEHFGRPPTEYADGPLP